MKNPTAQKLAMAVLLVLLFCLCGQEVFAQPGPPVPPGGGGPPQTPINGLIAIALVAGACFGVRKLKKYRKE